MLQFIYESEMGGHWEEVAAPPPLTLFEEIRAGLAPQWSNDEGGGSMTAGGFYTGEGGKWWIAGNKLYNPYGAAPLGVQAAYQRATPWEEANAMDPHGIGNDEGGSDIYNIGLGALFIVGGAYALTAAAGTSIGGAALAADAAAAPAITGVAISGSVTPEVLITGQAAMADIALGGVGGSEAAAALTGFFSPAAAAGAVAAGAAATYASTGSVTAEVLTTGQAAMADIALGGVGGSAGAEALLPFFETAAAGAGAGVALTTAEILTGVKTAAQVAGAGATLASVFGGTSSSLPIVTPGVTRPAVPDAIRLLEANPIQPAGIGPVVAGIGPLATFGAGAPASSSSGAGILDSLTTTQQIVAGVVVAALLAAVFYKRRTHG